MTEAPGVTVVGGSGFIGSAVLQGLREVGTTGRALVAPRLLARERTEDALLAEAVERTATVTSLARHLSGVPCVVNAAGVAEAGGGHVGELFGANALLARIVQLACREAGVARLVHVSSASVQGRIPVLDESSDTFPFSPYSQSKTVAEGLLGHDLPGLQTIIFRPTSVHGPARHVTRSLIQLARSPLASVAGTGDRPTPQVLVQNVGAAIAATATWPGLLPAVVLQPSESMTTAGVLRALGRREPRHVPDRLARSMLASASWISGHRPRLVAQARRLEMVWFGQEQQGGWLAQQGWSPPFGEAAWAALAEHAPFVALHREGSRQ